MRCHLKAAHASVVEIETDGMEHVLRVQILAVQHHHQHDTGDEHRLQMGLKGAARLLRQELRI